MTLFLLFAAAIVMLAAAPRRAGSRPGCDQADRDQRRRVLQHELGPSVRNPTPFANFAEMLMICLLPFALAFTFGRMVGDRRQGRTVFAVMFVIWGAMSLGAMTAEANGNPRLARVGVAETGGNMEGKKVRFGPAASGLWAATTSGTSNGSVNAMIDRYTPLGGMIPLAHMMLGEVSPGGVGVGLNGLLVMAILAVFIAGLMVGRTPEYLGKKVQAAEMKIVVLYLLAMPLCVLGFGAATVPLRSALATLGNTGPHGLSEASHDWPRRPAPLRPTHRSSPV